MRKTEAIAEAALKKQEASPDLLSNRTGSSHRAAVQAYASQGHRRTRRRATFTAATCDVNVLVKEARRQTIKALEERSRSGNVHD